MRTGTVLFAGLLGCCASAMLMELNSQANYSRLKRDMTPQSADTRQYLDGHSELRIITRDGKTNTLYSIPGNSESFSTNRPYYNPITNKSTQVKPRGTQ